MARYDELLVYKAAYDLLLSVCQHTENAPRRHRYSLLKQIEDELAHLLMLIYKANSLRQKEDVLRQCMELFAIVRVRIRLLKDLHIISLECFADFAVRCENISKQLTAWHRYSVKKNKK